MKPHRTLFFLLLIGLFITNTQVLPVQGEGVSDNTIYLPMVLKDYDPNWILGQPIKVQLSPTPLTTPYLVVDSFGRPHLLWATWPGSSAFIYHIYLTDQGWTNPAPIAPTLGNSKLLNPPIAGKNNDLYFVWYNALNLGGPYRIMYAAWNGSSWGPEVELLGNGPSIYINGMTRLDSQGVPNVAFLNTDGAFTSNYYHQKWTGTGFSAKQTIQELDNVSTVWLDSDGGIRFFGDDYFENSIHYSYWKNGAFSVNNKTVLGKLGYRDALLDGQNNLHLTRLASVPVPGGNVSGLYHQCLKSDLTWDSEQVLSGQNNILDYSVSFDENISPVMAWTHGDNQTITAQFWNGCQISKQKELALPTLPAGSKWGHFSGVSSNSQAVKTCFMSKDLYSSDTFWLECVGPDD